MNEEARHLQFNVVNIERVLADVDFNKLPLLAVSLGLEDVLSEIEHESVPKQRRIRLANTWIRRNPGANWESLSNALRHSTVEENRVAGVIEDRYMRRRSSSSVSTASSPGPLSPQTPTTVDAVRDLRMKVKVADKLRVATEKGLKESFDYLRALVIRKLSQQELDVETFRLYLKNLFSVDIPHTANSISTIISSIEEQKLSDYYNYGDIELIALRYLREDKEVRSAFEAHKDVVSNYHATRSIADYIEERLVPDFRSLTVSRIRDHKPRSDSRAYYDKLSLTLGDVYIGKKTLQYVRQLWKDLGKQLRLPKCNAVLDSIYFGSIVIDWLIPLLVSLELKRVQPWSAIHFLQETVITRMVLNETYCVYDINDSMKLVRVSSEGDFDEVSFLLHSEDKGAAVNATFLEIHAGKSALILSSELGHELVMLNLLDWGADVNFQLEASGRSALFFAAEKGEDAAVAILLAYGADPYLIDKDGETAYTVAKKADNEKVCKELEKVDTKKRVAVKSISTSQQISERLEEARVAVFRPFYQAYQQWAADLIGAARDDNMDVVQYILENHKADVNSRQQDRHGWTPLMWATENGNYDMVEFLLKKEADPNLTTKDTKWTSLLLASRKGHTKIAKALLDNRADPNAQNIEGVTALDVAAFESRTAVAMLLIHRGADIHIKAYNGWTPLIRASSEGNLKLLKILSDLGSYLNDPTEEGWTSLMVASHHGYTDIVKELADRRAQLDLTTDAGDSALHIASLQNHADVVKELASHGANLDIINQDGLTALMVAVNEGHQSVVDALLKGHADVNIKQKNTGWTAIFLATKNDRVDVLKQLLFYGAKSELEDGTTLIDVASDLKQMQVIDALGTSVDEAKVPLRRDTGYQEVYDSLGSFVQALKDRFHGLRKKYASP